MDQLVFRRLQLGDERELDNAQRIMAQEHFAFAFDYAPGQDFAAYLATLDDHRLGRNLRAGKVAASFEVGVLGARIVARLSVRHALNDFLLQQGGHIGYGVLPEFRGRGFATAALQRGLALTSSLGIPSVLVTCDEDNVPSRRTIEKAGGRYESSYLHSDGSPPTRRYWFERGGHTQAD